MASEVTRVYRHLLRSVPHAVRFNMAACQNIRRLLRDDFEGAIKTEMNYEQLVKQAQSTLLLYLSSTRCKEDPSTGNVLAHRAISNLSSLCYHNLSPHTQLQPNTKKTRMGGTDTALLRRRRSVQSKKRTKDTASLMFDSFESDGGLGGASSSSSTIQIDAQVLPSLVVTAKPIRGPIYPTFARQFLPAKWDGQRTAKSIQTSSAYLAHLESIVEGTSMQVSEALQKYGRDSPEANKLLERFRKERGEVKSALKRKAQHDKRISIQSEAIQALQGVVVKAQANNGPWLGANRFTKWATGGWLPP